MKRIIIFGFGEMGRKLAEECQKYDAGVEIAAIADSNPTVSLYMGIPVIKPKVISEYTYDEIWICTVYFKEIRKQLSDNYKVEKRKMRFAEPVIPVLEKRIREKYRMQLEGKEMPSSGELEAVLSYLRGNPLRMYCYSFYDEYLGKASEITYDDNAGLYFGIYKGHKMYLARSLDTEQKARAYFNAVVMEQDRRSPHCYWNSKGLCRVSGVGVDIGAAEGIFALNIIEQIEYIYLVEADEGWTEALRYTFAPYMDKVRIIRKFAGNKDCENQVKLDTVLSGKKIDFMKMDIEGMELEALWGSEKIILNNMVELAVCVYHHKKDNECIGRWLEERGYHTNNSKGLVVCQGDWELENNGTDFRKALLFANKLQGDGK